jgi:pimeloyl-ACP methyl ester carboxylesterase
MGHHEELRAAGRLTGQALGGAIDVVRGVHDAVLSRVDGFLPPGSTAATALQRHVSSAVFSGVGAAHRAAPAWGGGLAALAWTEHRSAPSSTRLGRVVLPAVNGLWGDTIADREPALAVPMTVRVAARDVPIDAPAIAQAYPAATGRLVVFLHGLCESDESWWRGTADDDPRLSYGDRLRVDLGHSPVYLRYNTGLRVSDNGRTLADLLESLTAQWPVPVDEVMLVGHSMGGLVARSACHQGAQSDMAWVAAVSTVVTLGTPHLGAPLEKAVHVADWLLSRLPETEPFARLFGIRSVGVRDLRYGALIEEDWAGHDPDEFLRDRCTEVPFVDHATYYWVAASLASDHTHPATRLLGDGLVRLPSASGAGKARRLPFEMGHGATVTGVDHLALLNHPDVYAQLRTWLDTAPHIAPGNDGPGEPQVMSNPN